MKFSLIKITLCGILFSYLTSLNADDLATKHLKEMYELHCHRVSDINEHLPIIKKLAAECASAMEIGVRSMVSTWALLKGLSESSCPVRSYIGIDLHYPALDTFYFAQHLAQSHNITFQFHKQNDMEINREELMPVDFLFIDSLHTYCHLTYELEKFSPQVRKYIAMHDTSAPWGNKEDTEYRGDYTEYPASYDRTKKGLWPAVEDFLSRHAEWKLLERRFNNHGFTILQRCDLQADASNLN